MQEVQLPTHDLLPAPDAVFCFDIETYFDKEFNLKKIPLATYIDSSECNLLTVAGVAYPVDKSDMTIVPEPHGFLWGCDKKRTSSRTKTLNSLLACGVNESPAFDPITGEERKPTVWLVGHNIAFDAGKMNYHDGVLKDWNIVYIDTLLLAQYLWHETGCVGKKHGLGLDALGETLFGIPKMENFKLVPGLLRMGIADNQLERDYLKELMKYNLIDTKITWKLFCYLIERVPANHVFTCHWAIKQFVEPQLLLNTDNIEAHKILCEQDRQAAIDKVPGATLAVLRSNDKCVELFKSYGIEVPTKRSPTNPNKALPQLATSDNFLVKNKNAKGMVGDIVRARIAAKSAIEITRADTMLKACLYSDKYRFHIAPSGAFTHRPAGRSGGGGNPLNLTRTSKLRRAIEAPLGKSLLVFDYSKMELMLARWGAIDKPAMHKLTVGEDMYTSFIASVLAIESDSVTEGQRFVGKTSQLSLQYGVGAETFCAAVNASGKYDMVIQEAERIVQYFRHTAHPRVTEAWNQCRKLLQSKYANRLAYFKSPEWDLKFPGVPVKDGWQWHGSGRVMRFPDIQEKKQSRFDTATVYFPMKPLSTATYRRIYPSAYFQSLCQGAANEVIDHCRANLTREGLNVVSECYDELTLIIDPVDEQDAIEAVNRIASTCHHSWWGDNPPPLKVDIGIGDNYYDAKP